MFWVQKMTHWPLFLILYKIIDISAFEKIAFLSIFIAYTVKTDFLDAY
jgi:hypothetical protein